MENFQNIQDSFVQRESKYSVYMRPLEQYGKTYLMVYKGAKDDPDSVIGKPYTFKSDNLSKAKKLASTMATAGNTDICVVQDTLIKESKSRNISSSESRKLNAMLNGITEEPKIDTFRNNELADQLSLIVA